MHERSRDLFTSTFKTNETLNKSFESEGKLIKNMVEHIGRRRRRVEMFTKKNRPAGVSVSDVWKFLYVEGRRDAWIMSGK